MLDVINETNTEVRALLAGAAKTIQAVRYCWLLTKAADSFNARPMGRIFAEKGEDEWTIRFVTDGRSRKAHEVCGEREVGLIFQSDPDEAYVALFGKRGCSSVTRMSTVSGRSVTRPISRRRPTALRRRSSRSTSSGWNSGSAALRRSRSDFALPSSRAMPVARGRGHEHAFMTMAK